MVQEELENRLRNWAWWTMWGHVGPEVRTQASSAEGNYESDDVWEGQEPKYEPDMLDGETLENAIRVLPDMSRRVLKVRYVSYPYDRIHSIAQKLKISTTRLESELHAAKRRLNEQLQRSSARNARVDTGPAGVRNSIPG
jgi:DNA-directed RNA polymerase specialized sigma24 family protein